MKKEEATKAQVKPVLEKKIQVEKREPTSTDSFKRKPEPSLSPAPEPKVRRLSKNLNISSYDTSFKIFQLENIFLKENKIEIYITLMIWIYLDIII